MMLFGKSFRMVYSLTPLTIGWTVPLLLKKFESVSLYLFLLYKNVGIIFRYGYAQ